MKNMKRILVTMVAAVLLMTVTVMGTLAYLQATTEPVVNTFTYGNVNFADLNGGLDEAPVDLYGEVTDFDAKDRVKANTYKLIPGHKYHKDPTVHIAANTEPCWVFIKVLNGIAGIEVAEGTGDTIAEQMAAQGWLPLEDEENVYYYQNIVDTLDPAEQLDLLIFSSFILKNDLSEEEIETFATEQIWIDAYLIQADNLGTAAEAWAVAEPGFTK